MPLATSGPTDNGVGPLTNTTLPTETPSLSSPPLATPPALTTQTTGSVHELLGTLRTHEAAIETALDTALAGIRQAFEAQNQQMAAALRALEQKEAELMAQNKRLNDNQAVLQQQAEEMAAKNEQMEFMLKRLRKKEAELTENNNALLSSEEEMRQQAEELAAINEDLEEKNRLVAQQMAATRLQAEEMAAKNEQMEFMLKRLRKKEEELTEKNNALISNEEELRQQAEELAAVNEDLEHKNRTVAAQMQTLEEREAELHHALQEVKQAQHKLVQREKMATLGQLVAGVAHEINTPIGAAKASAENVRDLLPKLVLEVPQFFRSMTERQFAQIHALLQVFINAENHNLSTREERQLRKQMAAALAETALPDPEDAARQMVEAGYVQDVSPLVPLLNEPVMAEGFVGMLSLFGLTKLNLDNILLAAEKTKKVVFALKSYLHVSSTDATDDFAPLDLRQNLDTILMLYHNQLKYGVELACHFDDGLPPVMDSSDSLGQVWTNLITNALQAINFRGEMAVRVLKHEAEVWVEIEDNGPGIPPDVQPRIFEPLFTTKAQGEGTGLGLDICRQIVERHQGHISFESQPGRTCFRVALPVLVAA